MFYGKECNYAFSKYESDCDFDVFFIENEKEDRSKYIHELRSNHYNNVDTCILWAAYELFCRQFKWERIVIQNADAEIEMEFKTQDELVEKMWETLTDVNIDENECIEQNWFIFNAGTDREEIWYWFDEHHSKGVVWLMYDRDRK